MIDRAKKNMKKATKISVSMLIIDVWTFSTEINALSLKLNLRLLGGWGLRVNYLIMSNDAFWVPPPLEQEMPWMITTIFSDTHKRQNKTQFHISLNGILLIFCFFSRPFNLI